MFGKKHDFKPDRPHSGALNKLYITPKQRRSLLKWFLLTVALVFISLVQDVVMSRVRIFDTTTDLLACAILMACIMQDPEIGCVFALASSCVYFCSGTSPGSFVIALLTGLGVVVSILRQCYLRKGFGSTMLCTGGAIMVYELSLFCAGSFLGTIPLSRLGAFCLSGLLSLAVMPVLYPIFLSIEKIGGEAWKE